MLGSRRCCLELAIVVSELVSNVLKHGIEGTIELDPLVDRPCGAGLVILATDIGPPFRNLELALQDGYDDRGPIDPGSMLRRVVSVLASAPCYVSRTIASARILRDAAREQAFEEDRETVELFDDL